MGTRTAAALATALVLLAACGADDGARATTPSATVATTSTAPRATTSTAAPATVAPSTTQAVTTTSEALPIPEPPPEPRADEPRIELGMIEIPRIDVTKSLFEGITLTTLDRGPGHWPGTAMPGHIGNVVIGGHRTSKDRPFRHLDELQTGDEVILSTLEGRFVYRVTRTEIVTPDALWITDQAPGFTATLFACHPVGSTRERIIVFLELDQAA